MAKKKKIVVGNWKMSPESPKEAVRIFSGIKKAINSYKRVQVVVCPPFVYLEKLSEIGKKKVVLGAQDMFDAEKGSYTSKTSSSMLKNLGVSYVIIGHSERRKLGETDGVINKKITAALKAKITPILCIGEEVRDEEGAYLSLLKSQLEKALAGVQKRSLPSIIIAYEPVWAIGATEAMNVHDIHEMTLFIKKMLIDMYKIKPPVLATPILYGGAVDTTNAEGILGEGQADGLLIGRQSLDPKSFTEIIKLANSFK